MVKKKNSMFAEKIVNEYDQEIPQSQTADKLVASWGEAHNNHETPGRQTKQSNQLSLPHRDDYKTRMDTKVRTTKHRTITESYETLTDIQVAAVRWSGNREL